MLPAGDVEQCRDLFREHPFAAAAQGDANGDFNYAEMLRSGEGGPKDIAGALTAYRAAIRDSFVSVFETSSKGLSGSIRPPWRIFIPAIIVA